MFYNQLGSTAKEACVSGIYKNVAETIGHTPLVRLGRMGTPEMAEACAKLEFFNPGGSVKDRIGLAMIEAAERDGRFQAGLEILEPT